MAGLVRGLTLLHATSLVAGSIIRAGVFLKTAPMAQQLGAPSLVLAAWGAAALLARGVAELCGARGSHA